MAGAYNLEPMHDLYIFETSHNVEDLEKLTISSEKNGCFDTETINEIFRIMHTVKGSSAMMLFTAISTLAHAVEDLFFLLREEKNVEINYSELSDLVLESVDFIKAELEKIRNGNSPDGDSARLVEKIAAFLRVLKEANPALASFKNPKTSKKQQYYISQSKSDHLKTDQKTFKAHIFFGDGCDMEDMRAYTVIHNLKEISEDVLYFPENILEDDDASQIIREKGFTVYVRTAKPEEEMHQFFKQTPLMRELQFSTVESEEFDRRMKASPIKAVQDTLVIPKVNSPATLGKETLSINSSPAMISVSVHKLDALMDLVGEMVIAETMVTQNPDLKVKGLSLNNFQKAARQLRKITGELQETVMSIRMVPIAMTFQKMHRIVRDMCKKLEKEVKLELSGAETEVDKNIIEHLSDPLIHIIRNAIDHGIESPDKRVAQGKPREGTIRLQAKSEGTDVLVIISDDGQGLNRDRILQKAKDHQLLTKPENELTDKEIYNFIFLPGLSTNDDISEYSGRGVGMDIVVKSLESVGGQATVESTPGVGTVFTLKIPLTLAIVDGMNARVGRSTFTIPTVAIKESFKPKEQEIITDPNGNEMIMVRGECYPILRLYQVFKIGDGVTRISDGILIMVEQEGRLVCLLVDKLLGQQQIVVKSLPEYIVDIKKIQGVSGCTLLGDGHISLILDMNGLINLNCVRKDSDKLTSIKEGD